MINRQRNTDNFECPLRVILDTGANFSEYNISESIALCLPMPATTSITLAITLAKCYNAPNAATYIPRDVYATAVLSVSLRPFFCHSWT